MVADKQIWFNGELVPADQAKVSVYDHGLLYGDGVFEGIRIYDRRVLKMRSHLQRLFDGAGSIELKIPYSIEQLEAGIRQTIEANGVTDGYIRLCVTRGAGTLGLNPYLCNHTCTFVIADSIAMYPPEMYESGLRIITAKTVRNHPQALNPGVKSMNYLNNILAKIEAIKAGVPEAVMLNHEGNVAECSGENISMVKAGRITTPPLSAGVLPGITRRIVIELAEAAGIPAAEQDMTRDELGAADEVFLTGSAAEIIPVTHIDDQIIGNGKPGPITCQLIDAFRQFVANSPED